MDMYSLLREFADSWALLAMFILFLGVILWALRPGARDAYKDVSEIPFRNDDRPASTVTSSTGKFEGQAKETVK